MCFLSEDSYDGSGNGKTRAVEASRRIWEDQTTNRKKVERNWNIKKTSTCYIFTFISYLRRSTLQSSDCISPAPKEPAQHRYYIFQNNTSEFFVCFPLRMHNQIKRQIWKPPLGWRICYKCCRRLNKCAFCDSSFSTGTEMKFHMGSTHPEEFEKAMQRM